MGKSNGTIRDRIVFCGACSKPIVGDNFFSVKTFNTGKDMKFHNTATDCANADKLERDWYRHYDKSSPHFRIETKL